MLAPMLSSWRQPSRWTLVRRATYIESGGVDPDVVTLPPGGNGLWERVFIVAPLVVIGTVEPDGRPDLAPKHQATPIGWSSYFGFVCTSAHRTHANVQRTGEFSVSFPQPHQAVTIGQAAAPRHDEVKSSLAAIPTTATTTISGVAMADAALWLECELDRIITGFDDRDFIVGRIVSAAAPRWAVRDPDRDDADLLHDHPPLAFLSPVRFGAVADTLSFPFPADFSR